MNFPEIYPVACHTNNVGPGSTFVAIKGLREDGAVHILLALERGATTIVVEHGTEFSLTLIKALHESNAELRFVANTRKELAILSAQAQSHSVHKLKIIAVTGTKGKTTTSFLTEHLLASHGCKTALLSTVKNKILGHDLPTQLTTQQPDYLHVFFSECVKAGVEWVVMEVAAQALSLHRVEGITFDAVIFTNFSQEHAEFYATNDDYFNAKKMIINHLKPHAPLLVNGDDRQLEKLTSSSFYSFSTLNDKADICITVLDSSRSGLSVKVHDSDNVIHCRALIGSYNASNIAAAWACLKNLGFSINILNHCSSFNGVPGRLSRVELKKGCTAFIDYAHNESSFEAVLSTLRGLTNHLIVVFGAGGDRDKIKRPLMGKVASLYGDVVIVTDDNPRFEDPQHIITDIMVGIMHDERKKVIIERDRSVALAKAYELSQEQSIIAVLGKGPDEYQLIKGVKIPFSERMILEQC